MATKRASKIPALLPTFRNMAAPFTKSISAPDLLPSDANYYNMDYSTRRKLTKNGHSPPDLISRVKDALDPSIESTETQNSGLQRFFDFIDTASADVSTELLVDKFFHFFDDIFFDRSLRYCVEPSIELSPNPEYTCCSGLARGAKLVIKINEASPRLQIGILERLLHDMIHVYLWRLGHSSFTKDDLFVNGWGFSGHGAPWQDIATMAEEFMTLHEHPLDLGRNETLKLELEEFAKRMRTIRDKREEFLLSPTIPPPAPPSSPRTGFGLRINKSKSAPQINQLSNQSSNQERTTEENQRPRQLKRRSSKLTKQPPASLVDLQAKYVESAPAGDDSIYEVISELVGANLNHLKNLERR